MSRFGLNLGQSYTSQSPNVAADVLFNWYTEKIESGTGKSDLALYPTPGLRVFCAMPGLINRGVLTFNGRTFSVVDGDFNEVFANGTFINRGTVAHDLLSVSMVAGPGQVLIASAGIAYVFDLTTNVLTPVNPATLANVQQVDYMDGFYIALIKNSNTLQSSKVLDATVWLPGVQETIVSEFPDIVRSIKVVHERLIVQGIKASTAYYDAGLPQFPFDVDQGAGVIQQGITGTFCSAIADNTIFWMGQNERGSNMFWRANGYSPVRVSTHAIEYAWSKYPTVMDAIAYSYQDQGHEFVVIYFPTANATWVYDVATGLWAQRGTWNGLNFDAHRSRNHVYAFGKHLVGDTESGNLFDMSINYLDDAGTAIRRVRRAPHLSTEQSWIFHERLQLDIETGLGPIPPLLDGNGNPRDPEVFLRWSDDGGHAWSNYYSKGIGQAGHYKQRVIWRRLGRSRDRVYEVSGSDPVAMRIIDAYLEASPGYQKQERIAAQIRKVS